MEFYDCPIILGSSSSQLSQLTNSIIFSEWLVETTNTWWFHLLNGGWLNIWCWFKHVLMLKYAKMVWLGWFGAMYKSPGIYRWNRMERPCVKDWMDTKQQYAKWVLRVVPLNCWWGMIYWLKLWVILTGNLTWLWKITIFDGKIHYRWPFSIAMLNYQRVLTGILRILRS